MYPLHRLFLSLNRTLEDSSIQPKGCEKTTCWPSSPRDSDVENKYFVSTGEFIKIIHSDNGAQKVTINLGPDGIKCSLWCILIWMILDHKFPMCNRTIPVPGFNKYAKKKHTFSPFLTLPTLAFTLQPNWSTRVCTFKHRINTLTWINSTRQSTT